MGPYSMYLPREEPPDEVKAAVRLVRLWMLEVEARERATRDAFHKQMQNIQPAKDWRDEIFG